MGKILLHITKVSVVHIADEIKKKRRGGNHRLLCLIALTDPTEEPYRTDPLEKPYGLTRKKPDPKEL